MAKNKNPLGVPATQGHFQISGLISGVESERFYAEKNTKSDKPRRTLNFAIMFDKDKKAYVEQAGMEQKSVWFSKSELDKATGKRNTETIEIPWRERNTFKQEGYGLIGISLGLEQTVEGDGNIKNIKKTLAPFDACKYASEHMKDNMAVFAYGDITYSTYNDEHRKRFEFTRVFRNKVAPDFDADDFAPVNHFEQRIVYMGIRPSEDKTRYIVSAKIVTRNSVEDAEFIVEKKGLANTLRKVVKPYTAMDVFGYINVIKNEEEHSGIDENGLDWGGPNMMKRKRASTTIELVIDGVDDKSLDTEVYNEAAMEEAVRLAKNLQNAKKDFGDKDDEVAGNDWGSGSKLSDADDEEGDEDW